jgi:hypothetical protein
MTTGDVHQWLAEAAYFLRAGDPLGGARRARDAVAGATDDALREEAELTVERCEEAARAWLRAIDHRESEHRVLDGDGATTRG